MLIFKYLSPSGAHKLLANKGSLEIRFGQPKTYNDPYELFLQTNTELESTAERAFFQHLLGEIPQMPVTCFSRIPDSIPMWAHYGREQKGICIALEEDAFVNTFPRVYVCDVEYSDKPAQIDSYYINYALTTGKRRHAEAVLSIAYKAAYFVKRMQWQYECERRFVVGPDDVQQRDNYFVANVDVKALKYLIMGSKVDDDLRELCSTRALENGTPLFEFRNGKKTYEPFFLRVKDNQAFRWDGNEFKQITAFCPSCLEPGTLGDSDRCVWCSIGENDRKVAATSNMLFLAVATGLQLWPVSFHGLEVKGRDINKDEPTS